MALVVQKYGGSSVATPEQIRILATRILARHDEGNDMVIVVSAMGKTTDGLVRQAKELCPSPDPREMDMLLSVGERVSISMMSIALNALRPNVARALTGSQIGLITDCRHGDARVLEIRGDRLRQCLAAGKIAVVAGFQGVSTEREITTLGRGGSDTTAVAVAAALGADVCEIYSDVDGVYTADPRLVPDARRLDTVDYSTMLTMSAAGAKVLKDDAVEYARRLGVRIAAGASASGRIGSLVSDENLNRDGLQALVYSDHLRWLEFPEQVGVPENCRLYQNLDGRTFAVVEEKSANGVGQPCYALALIGSQTARRGADLAGIFPILARHGLRVLAISDAALKYEIFLGAPLESAWIAEIHDLLFAKKEN